MDQKTVITSKIDDDYGRKVWQIQEPKVAKSPQDIIEQKKEELKFLESRKEDLDFTKVISKKTGIEIEGEQSGFRCDLCDVVMKDSSSYLDHINGQKHNRLKGMNMKVERVTADQVRNKFNVLKKKQDTKIKNFEEFEQKFDEKKQDIKKKVKVDNKQIMDEILENVDQDLFAAMGLPVNFGMKK